MLNTPLRKEILTDAYHDLRLLVYQITHRFSKRYSIPFEDLVSESHVLFVEAYDKYDRAKGASLSSWVYAQVSWGLMTFMRKELKHRGLKTLEEAPEQTQNPHLYLMELQSELSEDARGILSVLLSSGKDFSIMCRWSRADTHTKAMNVLREHLEDLGWQAREIARGLEELAAHVNGRRKNFDNEDEAFWDEYTCTARDEVWLLNKIGLSPQQVQRSFLRQRFFAT